MGMGLLDELASVLHDIGMTKSECHLWREMFTVEDITDIVKTSTRKTECGRTHNARSETSEKGSVPLPFSNLFLSNGGLCACVLRKRPLSLRGTPITRTSSCMAVMWKYCYCSWVWSWLSLPLLLYQYNSYWRRLMALLRLSTRWKFACSSGLFG